MKNPGQIVLFKFPQVDQIDSKLRPPSSWDDYPVISGIGSYA
jgi:hypothetical protein